MDGYGLDGWIWMVGWILLDLDIWMDDLDRWMDLDGWMNGWMDG